MSDRSRPVRRVTLELEPSTDGIRGSLRNPGGETRAFEGWLELSTLLDDLRPRPSVRPAAGRGARNRTIITTQPWEQ